LRKTTRGRGLATRVRVTNRRRFRSGRPGPTCTIVLPCPWPFRWKAPVLSHSKLARSQPRGHSARRVPRPRSREAWEVCVASILQTRKSGAAHPQASVRGSGKARWRAGEHRPCSAVAARARAQQNQGLWPDSSALNRRHLVGGRHAGAGHALKQLLETGAFWRRAQQTPRAVMISEAATTGPPRITRKTGGAAHDGVHRRHQPPCWPEEIRQAPRRTCCAPADCGAAGQGAAPTARNPSRTTLASAPCAEEPEAGAGSRTMTHTLWPAGLSKRRRPARRCAAFQQGDLTLKKALQEAQRLDALGPAGPMPLARPRHIDRAPYAQLHTKLARLGGCRSGSGWRAAARHPPPARVASPCCRAQWQHACGFTRGLAGGKPVADSTGFRKEKPETSCERLPFLGLKRSPLSAPFNGERTDGPREGKRWTSKKLPQTSGYSPSRWRGNQRLCARLSTLGRSMKRSIADGTRHWVDQKAPNRHHSHLRNLFRKASAQRTWVLAPPRRRGAVSGRTGQMGSLPTTSCCGVCR